MSDLLYGEEVIKTEEYRFNINTGGELNIQETGTVTIVFVNGELSHVSFPFRGGYSRNGWRILVATEAKITEIEERIKP